MRLIGIHDARESRRRQSRERISPREAQVLELAEFTVADIAAQLGISPNTVKTHLRALFDQSGSETRAQLVSWRERCVSPCAAADLSPAAASFGRAA